MKNFSKTLISMAAVMAVGSAMAVGAMAETLNIEQTNLTKDGTITISNVTPNKSQYTLLVVKGTDAGDGTYTYDANSDTIKQVDQNDAGTAFSTIVLGTKQADNTYKLDEGSYKVLVGNNDGSLDSGIFTVSNTPAVVTRDYYVGDVNFDKKHAANSTDATYILRAAAGVTDPSLIGYAGKEVTVYGTTDTITIGDVNFDKKKAANSTDATYILRAAAGITDPSLIGHINDDPYVIIWDEN